MKQKMRAWAEISLHNIEFNVKSLRAAVPERCKFAGIVKANAYGHGILQVTQAVLNAGADYLAVACFAEASQLREAGVCAPILIMGVTPPCFAEDLAELNITQAVSSLAYAKSLNEKVKKPLKVHIKLDTGMGRTGFSVRDEDFDDIQKAIGFENLNFEGVFTHFSVSDVPTETFTNEQFARFKAAIEKAQNASCHTFDICHCANSGAVINYRELALDMIRPGVATYGMYPAQEHGGIELRPALELKARICSITNHYAGDTISYGRTYTASKEMRVAVLPIGYGDGLHRCLSGRMDVIIRGRRCPQIGRICMDMCMVDITDLPDCEVGDVATLIGSDGNETILASEMADKAGTINYEITCALTQRVERIYK